MNKGRIWERLEDDGITCELLQGYIRFSDGVMSWDELRKLGYDGIKQEFSDFMDDIHVTQYRIQKRKLARETKKQ